MRLGCCPKTSYTHCVRTVQGVQFTYKGRILVVGLQCLHSHPCAHVPRYLFILICCSMLLYSSRKKCIFSLLIRTLIPVSILFFLEQLVAAACQLLSHSLFHIYFFNERCKRYDCLPSQHNEQRTQRKTSNITHITRNRRLCHANGARICVF